MVLNQPPKENTSNIDQFELQLNTHGEFGIHREPQPQLSPEAAGNYRPTRKSVTQTGMKQSPKREPNAAAMSRPTPAKKSSLKQRPTASLLRDPHKR